MGADYLMNLFYDFSGDELLLNPYPAYRQLLESGGVLHDETNNRIYLGRYDDVRAVLGNATQFSSSNNGLNQTMLGSGGSSHSRLRSVLQPAFQPGVLARELTRLNELTDMHARNLSQMSEPCDFVDAFAARIPTMVLSWMFGDEKDRCSDYGNWSWALKKSPATEDDQGKQCVAQEYLPGSEQQHPVTREQLIDECKAYLDETFQNALESSTSGWVARILIDAYRDGRVVYQDLIETGLLLMVGAHETTTKSLTNAMVILAGRQDIWERVREDEDLVKPFIEEVFRFDPPVQRRPRLAVEDVRIGGLEITAGTHVVALIAAANRDPGVFEDADEFLLNRERNPHVSFGFGPHVCLGMQLARIEMISSINSLRRHIGSFRQVRKLTADDYRDVLSLRSPKQLWLELTHQD
ncbi:hypothetical protein BOW47_06995 [Solemya velum gill symbiont]|nr:hypothetical protein BOW47_06995 [Solemya velum gill symbiont]